MRVCVCVCLFVCRWVLAWSSHRKNMSSVEKIVIFTYLVSLDAEFL